MARKKYEMDEETGKESNYGKSRMVLSLYSNERLNDDGSPNPLLVGKNKLELGYTCPEREYIESVVPPTMAYLARKWKIGIDTLKSWHDDDDWPSRRAREWLRVEKMAFDSNKERLAELRNIEQARQRETLMMMRTLLDEKIKDGIVIESTSTGQIYSRPLSIKEMKEATAAYTMINDGINNSLGIQKNLGRLDDSAATDDGKKVRRVIHRHTVTETHLEIPEPEIPALPEAGQTYDVAAEMQSQTEKTPVQN